MDTTKYSKNQVRYRVGLDHASYCDATATHGSDRRHQVDAVVGASLTNLSALAQSTRTHPYHTQKLSPTRARLGAKVSRLGEMANAPVVTLAIPTVLAMAIPTRPQVTGC